MLAGAGQEDLEPNDDENGGNSSNGVDPLSSDKGGGYGKRGRKVNLLNTMSSCMRMHETKRRFT